MCLTQAFSLFDILYIYVNKCMILRHVFNAGKVLRQHKVICDHNFKIMNHMSLICFKYLCRIIVLGTNVICIMIDYK